MTLSQRVKHEEERWAYYFAFGELVSAGWDGRGPRSALLDCLPVVLTVYPLFGIFGPPLPSGISLL